MLSSTFFMPECVNAKGCAIGSGTDCAYYWDGFELNQLGQQVNANPNTPLLNDQNIAIMYSKAGDPSVGILFELRY